VKTLNKAQKVAALLIFVLILFTPLIIEYIFIEDFVLTIQRIFTYYRDKTATLVFSDMLFLQGGALILIGVLVAGVILYNAWGTTNLLFRKYIPQIWNTKVMEQERRAPVGVLAGLILIGVGIIYIITGVSITL